MMNLEQRWLKSMGVAAGLWAAQLASIPLTLAAEPVISEVVVTGSRIRQNPVELTAPVISSSAADIDRSGEVALADYLQRLPISGSAINRSNNASGNLGFPPDGGGIGAGASEIDLRYLTSKRVLVLIDGKRWVRGSSGSGVSGAVDLNTIPTGAIERIEVLQDGASAIYGSDAIGGVVNIITRTSYDGFEAETHQGAFDEGDGYSQDYNFFWGASGERSRAFLTAAFSRQAAVFADDRALSQEVIFGAPPGVGGSSGTPQGRFIFLDPRGDVDGDGETDVVSITLNNGVVNDGVRKPVYDPNNPGSADFHDFGTADRFNFRPFNYFVTPNRRVNLFTKAEYDVSDSVVFKATAAFTNRKSANQAAPNPLFFGSDASAGFFLDNVFIPADQRFNPFGIDLDGRTNLITLGRRPLEAGPRIFEQNANTLMFSGAFEGNFKLGERTLFWDVGVSYGRNDATQRGRNIFNARKLALAVGPEDACLATPGCVPFNLFGGQGADGRGSITREMLAFTTFTQNDQSEQELNDVVANLSGDVVELPAGMLSYAVGLEYRKEQGSFTPDSTVQAGETADVPALPTAGETRVTEGYLELRAPLLADLPGVQRLELSAAVRAFDYEDIGSDQIFKTGLYWRVFNDLSLRANYAQGFRAPNVGELFNSGSRFDAALNDPCSGFSAPGRSAQIAQNCAALGVPTSFSQINQQISVQTGGNRNLEPETSDSYTLGFGYRPAWAKVGWIDDATLDVNYYHIQVDDAIQALSAQVQLSNCVASLSPAFCGGIVRGPGGSITAFANQLTNIGRIETDGIDWTLSLASTPLRFGSLRVTWANTYLGGYKEFTLGATGLVATERAGTEVGSPTRGYVRYKSSLIGDWLLGDFVTSLTVRYLSKLEESCPSALIDANLANLCSDPASATNEIDARVFTDLQVAWAANVLGQDMQLALGVNNILDEDPPPCLSCDLNNYDGTLYPVPGRFLHARLAIKF